MCYKIIIERDICQEIKMSIKDFCDIRSNTVLQIMKFYHMDPCLRN